MRLAMFTCLNKRRSCFICFSDEAITIKDDRVRGNKCRVVHLFARARTLLLALRPDVTHATFSPKRLFMRHTVYIELYLNIYGKFERCFNTIKKIGKMKGLISGKLLF